MFPFFETINWFAAENLLQTITKMNAEEQRCPAYLLAGLKSFVPHLKQWNIEKDVRIFSSIANAFEIRLIFFVFFLVSLAKARTNSFHHKPTEIDERPIERDTPR